MTFKGKLNRKAKKQLALIASKPNYCPPTSKKLECYQCKYVNRCVYARTPQHESKIYYENHRLTDYITKE